MRPLPQLLGLALLTAALAYPLMMQAQEHPVLFGFRPTVALIDHERDATLQGTGFQVSAYVARPFAFDFAGLLELGVTSVSHSHRVYYPPCPSFTTACGFSSSLGDETAISLAPGFQWYTTDGARKAAFTLTSGAVWFVNRPTGAQAVVPKLGGRFDVGWLLSGGPRLGCSLGVEWWGTTGTLPRWVLPLGLTVELR